MFARFFNAYLLIWLKWPIEEGRPLVWWLVAKDFFLAFSFFVLFLSFFLFRRLPSLIQFISSSLNDSLAPILFLFSFL